MTMRSKQWYTNTSRLANSFVNVSIGRPPLIESRQQDHRSDGRWSQNFKYVWLVLRLFDLAAGLVLPGHAAFQTAVAAAAKTGEHLDAIQLAATDELLCTITGPTRWSH